MDNLKSCTYVAFCLGKITQEIFSICRSLLILLLSTKVMQQETELRILKQ